MPHSLQSLLTQDKAALESALALDSDTARIEVQMLLQQVLDVPRAWLLAHPEQTLDEAQEASYRALLQRRLAGEPLTYILGEREFFGLTFKVTPATLIPRPETELLVEMALERISSPPASLPRVGEGSKVSPLPQAGKGGRQAGRGGKFRVLDLGTGSGSIALAIAHARPDIEVTAVDASPEALEVARENAQRLLARSDGNRASVRAEPDETTSHSTKPASGQVAGYVEARKPVHTSTDSVRTDISIANARLLRSDWFSALAGERFDLIVSNPPYIADNDAHLAQGDLRFEPRAALVSGSDGLDDIRAIVRQAKGFLEPGGWLLLEHGYGQAVQVRELLQQEGFNGVFSARDLAGIDRVSGGHT